VNFDPEQSYTALPRPSKSKDIPFEILWEDKHLVFVNKPAGLLTVPAENHQDPCLAEAIQDHYRRRGYKRFHLFIAHRLDRFTSGVLVFAKTPEALNGLKNIFEDHHLHRIYKAILVGELPENAGTLTDKLVERKSLRMDVVPQGSHAKHDIKGAKIAVTHYRVLERLPGHTVVEVKLETGRRNQIRVQFADRGYPLLGDQVYGVESPQLDRQALHAELLGFRHPVTEETVTVTAPIPADMEKVLKALRNVRRVVRAETGVTGEEGIYKPKITKDRKNERKDRAQRFAPEAVKPAAAERPRRAAAAVQGERPAAPRPRTRPASPAGKPEASGVGHAYVRPEAPKPKAPRGRAEGAKAPRAKSALKPAGTVRTFAPRKPKS
jgi:23S rRNA pseudouridine1911/1915/1917 synthase